MCIEGFSSDSAWTKWKVRLIINIPNYSSVYINTSLNLLLLQVRKWSKKKNIQRQGEVREFYFKSGENWRFEEKSGKIEMIYMYM